MTSVTLSLLLSAVPMTQPLASPSLGASAPINFSMPTGIEPLAIASPFPQDVDDDPARVEDDSDLVEPFGSGGTWRFNVRGGLGNDLKRDNQFGIGGVSFSYFMVEDVSIEFELNGMFVSQTGDDAAGFNFNILLRWHFWTEERWSMFVEAGAGVLLTTGDVPPDGSQFNFTPQGGVGFTYEIKDDVRLVVGGRLHHISNANTFEDNPGRDSVMGYVALSFPF